MTRYKADSVHIVFNRHFVGFANGSFVDVIPPQNYLKPKNEEALITPRISTMHPSDDVLGDKTCLNPISLSKTNEISLSEGSEDM